MAQGSSRTTAFSIRPGLDGRHRVAAAELFWAAFAGKLGLLMRPDHKAIAFLVRVIDPSHAFSAVSDNGELLGVAGFKTRNGTFVGGGLRDLAAVYGWIGALWRGVLLELLERKVEPGLLLMDGIFVHETARGLGVGSALLDTIHDEAKRRGLSGVKLDVIDTNPRAQALYERKGYRPVSVSQTGPFRWLFGFRAATTMVRPTDAGART